MRLTRAVTTEYVYVAPIGDRERNLSNPVTVNSKDGLRKRTAAATILVMLLSAAPLLQARTSDERAAAIRALIRLDAEHSKEKIYPLLQDPVHDVRKAASTALRSNVQKDITGPGLPAPAKSADGSRSWTVGETNDADSADDNDWKARLRSMMGE